METKIPLYPELFSERERLVASQPGLSAHAFRFDSGVCGLRLRNDLGELVLLPYQGQQIWSASMCGRPLNMTSMFSQPNPTRTYLETYGAFLLHCGVTGMGVPGPQDSHPLHGELPNAPYQKAWLVLGEDEKGAYLGLGGQYQHTVAFNFNYVAEPLVKLYAHRSTFTVSFSVTNLKNSPMEYLYLAHINYRPVDNGRIVYSALPTPEHVRVRSLIPPHIHPGPGYVEFIQTLKDHPEHHHLLTPDKVFDPEVVFSIDYLAGPDGWAHSLQVHPDGSADYVRHAPAQLPKIIRWMVRTVDQQALGFAMPGTAESDGYTAEKAKGNLKVLAGHEHWGYDLELGVLRPEEAARVEAKIAEIINAAG